MNYLLSLMISTLLGFLGTNTLRSQGRIDPLWMLIASIGLGLALSAQIIFYTLFILGQYSASAVWIGHAVALLGLLIINHVLYRRNRKDILPKLTSNRIDFLGLLVLSLLLIPLWREAHFYPFGGWDAWASWNLKAKFIFLGGENWKAMLDPSMWRSNNQYPFFLPLVNVWGWTIAQEPSASIPLSNTILFSFLTACTMFWGLLRFDRNLISLLPPLILFSIPFVNTLAISQYSDGVLGFYLLGCVIAIIIARRKNNQALAIISGIFCGVMGFIKTEGLLASAICATVITAYLAYERREDKSLLPSFVLAAAISALPAIFFMLLWATPNVSFINGLTSVDHPATWLRLKAIFMFYGLELISVKWNGLWFLLACGIFIGGRRCLRNGLFLIPLCLTIYLAGITFYYWINTHYEILWWMSTTLNRILYTLLPLVTWWVFTAILSLQSPEKK